MNTGKALMIFLTVVLAASCAGSDGRWENSNLPKEAWARDEAACRRAASERAEKDYALDQQRSTQGYSRTRAYTASMSRYEAEKSEKKLFERCMTRNGYVRVENTPEPK